MAKEKPTSQPKVGAAQAIRDVFVASINRGQFPLAIVGAIVLLIIWKMPSGDVSKLVFLTLDHLEAGSLLGYLLAACALTGWYIHARHQRRLIARELDRLSEERNRIQEEHLGKKMKSSEAHP